MTYDEALQTYFDSKPDRDQPCQAESEHIDDYWYLRNVHGFLALIEIPSGKEVIRERTLVDNRMSNDLDDVIAHGAFRFVTQEPEAQGWVSRQFFCPTYQDGVDALQDYFDEYQRRPDEHVGGFWNGSLLIDLLVISDDRIGIVRAWAAVPNDDIEQRPYDRIAEGTFRFVAGAPECEGWKSKEYINPTHLDGFHATQDLLNSLARDDNAGAPHVFVEGFQVIAPDKINISLGS